MALDVSHEPAGRPHNCVTVLQMADKRAREKKQVNLV